MTLAAMASVPSTALLSSDTRVLQLSSTPGQVFSVQLWSVKDKARLTDVLLTSGHIWHWDSATPQGRSRPLTRLSIDTASDLQSDMSYSDQDDKGRRYALDATLDSNPLPTARSSFLETGKGLEILIHQCNDSDDYIFVAANPSHATLRLLERLFVPSQAKSTSEPLWLKRTRKTGNLPA